MKKAEKIILQACAYTVLICFMFLLFAQISGFTTATLSFGKFMLLVLFGAVIAVANMLWEIKSWHYMLKLIVHFASLMSAFFVVFVISGNIKASGGGAILAAVFVFTFLYALIFTITYFVKKSINTVDKKLDSKSSAASKKEEKYTPRFK